MLVFREKVKKEAVFGWTIPKRKLSLDPMHKKLESHYTENAQSIYKIHKTQFKQNTLYYLPFKVSVDGYCPKQKYHDFFIWYK